VVSRVHGRPSLTTVREYLPNADHAAENREIERREMQDADGIITLPGKSGHVVVTVQIKESSQTLEAQERAIAEVARAVYNHFTARTQTNLPGG